MVFCSVPRVLIFLSFVMALGLGQMARADAGTITKHVAVNLASFHLNATRDFNEFNPGLGFGASMPAKLEGSEFAIEAGHYRNSLGKQSVYVMGSFDMEMFEIAPNARVRIGVFGGMARYAGDAAKFKRAGVPTIDDWIAVAGLQTTVRVNDTYDFRVRIMPAGHVADALLTFQFSTRF